MPDFDIEPQANAQVTVSIVAAGFAFAAFVLLVDSLQKQEREGRPSQGVQLALLRRQILFESAFLLVATFAVGVLSSYFYGLSLGRQPDEAYRMLQFAQALFVLELLALTASVLWLLGAYSPLEVRANAWGIAMVIVVFVQGRVIAESIQYADVTQDMGPTTVVILLVLGAAGPVGGLLHSIAREPLADDSRRVNDDADIHRRAPFVFIGAFTLGATGIALLQTVFTFGRDQEHLPSAVLAILVLVTGGLSGWMFSLSRPTPRWRRNGRNETTSTMPAVSRWLVKQPAANTDATSAQNTPT